MNETGETSSTEQRSEANEAELTRLFELSPDILAIASMRDGLWRRVNPAMVRTLGFTEAELLARPFMSLIHPEDVGRTEQALAGLARGDPLLDFEVRILEKDGGHRWIAWHTAALPEQGLLYCAGRDVTARRRAEAERFELLARAQQARNAVDAERRKLESLFMQAPVAIAILEGPSHIFSFANPAYRALVPGRELLGKTLLEALPDLRDQAFEGLLAEVMRSGETHTGKEVPVRFAHHGPGELLYVDFVYAPKRNAAGEIDGVLVCAFDVTDHVRAREAADAARAELETIFQTLPDAVYVGDATGIRRANQPALEMLGYETLTELNRHVAILAQEIQTRRADTGEVIDAAGQAFTHALQGTPDVQEVRVRHLKTGRERVVRSSCAPIRVGGEVVGAVAVNTDITAMKATESALRDRAEFEEQLIGIVSHDLRNPLTAIGLTCAGLLRREALDERSTMALLRIQSSAERATRLVKDLLDFTQARLGGGIPVQPRPLDLHALADEIVEEVQANFPERELRREAEGDARGTWDPDRMGQVVTNLVTNAVKYSPPGTPVTVRTRGERLEVVLEVHNLGAPIAPENLPRLFAPMQRLDGRADTSGRSVGLGLYIVKNIVAAHHGTVDVRSTEAEGTTFRVVLPRQ